MRALEAHKCNLTDVLSDNLCSACCLMPVPSFLLYLWTWGCLRNPRLLCRKRNEANLVSILSPFGYLFPYPFLPPPFCSTVTMSPRTDMHGLQRTKKHPKAHTHQAEDFPELQGQTHQPHPSLLPVPSRSCGMTIPCLSHAALVLRYIPRGPWPRPCLTLFVWSNQLQA